MSECVDENLGLELHTLELTRLRGLNHDIHHNTYWGRLMMKIIFSSVSLIDHKTLICGVTIYKDIS